MKTATYHISNMGRFNSGIVSDTQGYVIIHDSTRYSKADDDQLLEWAASGRTLAVRNAAYTEINNRAVNEWQESNCSN